jgi:hypothetical protein
MAKNGNSLLMVGILAVIGFLLFNAGAFDQFVDGSTNEAGQTLSGGSCAVQYQQSLSGLTSGVTENCDGNDCELIITSADLNSVNSTAIGFTLTNIRTDECRTADGDLLSDVLNYKATAYTMTNKVDTSDSTKYYTATYDADVDKQYNITVDGVEYATVFGATDVVTHATSGSGAVVIDVESYTTLDKLVKENYDSITIAKIETDSGVVTLKYMKD